MANRVTIEVLGLRELDDLLHRLPQEVKRAPIIYRALHDGARVIVPEAKRLAPVLQDEDRAPRRQYGALRAGITQHADRRAVEPTVVIRVRSRGYIFAPGSDSRRNPKSSVRAGNPNYWWLVEFGTSRAKAQPFLRPAFESRKLAAANAVRDSLRRGVLAVARSLGFRG